MLLYGAVWNSLTQGAFWKIALTGLVYVFATTEGSAFMMARMLKKETGKRQVGAR